MTTNLRGHYWLWEFYPGCTVWRESSKLLSISRHEPSWLWTRWGSVLWKIGGISANGLNLPLDILKTVKAACPKLQHLSLALGCLPYEGCLPDDIKSNHEELETVRYGPKNNLQVPLFDIGVFQNLKTLDLFNIYGNLRVQARNIGVVLAENPQLRELSLFQFSLRPFRRRVMTLGTTKTRKKIIMRSSLWSATSSATIWSKVHYPCAGFI